MSTHFEHYKSGHVFGIRYRFDERGDGIPKHSHPPVLAHNIVIMRGSVLLTTDDEDYVCGPGVHDFDWSKPHEISALEDHTEALHLFLNGQPEGYDSLPESELRGVLANPG
jgi:quercetin dioxygenase-like cupin family protein